MVTLKLYMQSSGTEQVLQITMTMYPFKLVIDGVSYGSTMVNPPVGLRPFDLLITCGVDNFRVYADGEAVTSAIATYHLQNNNLVTPNVYAAEYTVTDSTQTTIKKISWNYSKQIPSF